MDALIVGCGLSGAVVARELAEKGYKVTIVEKRNHIAGNMYDYVDDYGILVQQYGPHTFHTKKKNLYEYMSKYSDWEEYKLECGAVINGKCTPTPFNFKTIDDFYDFDHAEELKQKLTQTYDNREFVTVLEVMNSTDEIISEYGDFLFQRDYSLYTAKQWGVDPSTIDTSVLKRVPLRLSYNTGYFDDYYQVMPKESFASFFKSLLDHDNITVILNKNVIDDLVIKDNKTYYCGEVESKPIIYTGPIDELFGYRYGSLPYRSLRFEWHHEEKPSFQDMPVVAYPMAKDYTRITEYTKLPYQVGKGTTYAVEYPLPYKAGITNEPYYPVLTDESQRIYHLYKQEADSIPNLFVLGRLGDFKYYNMDQTLERALEVVEQILKYLS